MEGFPLCEVGECANAEDLINLVMSEKWDVVISDISMPGRSGLDALKQIQMCCPYLPVLMLTMYPEEQYAMRAFKAGAFGYFTKHLAQEELITAIRKILSGRKYITPSLAEILLDHMQEEQAHKSLSDREFHVFKLLASGKPLSKIAFMLSLSTATISTYRARILGKMKLENNADLTRYALEHNLI